ncbi:protein of unknown function [Paraburkholderia kururiensis]
MNGFPKNHSDAFLNVDAQTVPANIGDAVIVPTCIRDVLPGITRRAARLARVHAGPPWRKRVHRHQRGDNGTSLRSR